jgi:hypothetical protein
LMCRTMESRPARLSRWNMSEENYYKWDKRESIRVSTIVWSN